MTNEETLRAWMKDSEAHIESGVSTDLVAVCPTALAAASRELLQLREWHANGRANIEYQGDVVRICQGHHEKFEPCTFVEYRRAAERSADEERLRSHAEDLRSPYETFDMDRRREVAETIEKHLNR